MGKHRYVELENSREASDRCGELYGSLSRERKSQIDEEWSEYSARNAGRGTLMLPWYLWVIGRLG